MKIERLEWEKFLRYLRRAWRAGDHIALLGPAGRGKTFLATEILDTRRYIVALDIKGGRDPVMQRLVTDKGFEQITTWPIKDERTRIRRGDRLRILLSPPNGRPEDLPKMAELFRAVLRDIYIRGGWSVYLDEMRVITDPQSGMGLGREVENLLLVKRFEGVSVIGSSQAPRWVPHAMYDQSVHSFFFRNRDDMIVKRLAEIAGGGSDRVEVAAAVKSLAFHDVLYVGGRSERSIRTKAVPTGPRGD